MAETKAEDDDDVALWDFTFPSFPSQTVHSIQINGHNSSTTTDNDDDDDEWGDFVEYALRSELASGLSLTQSPPNPSESPKPFDPFGFFSDHSTKSSQSGETRIDSGKRQWVKPKGALPLSIFGDAEEGEESGMADPLGDKHADNIKIESNIPLDVGINDIIANLYSQNQHIMADNGLNSNSNGSSLNLNGKVSDPSGVNLNMNGSMLNPSPLNSDLDSVAGNGKLDIITNIFSQSQEIKTENGCISNSYQLDSNSVASISNLRGPNSDFNGLNLNLDSIGGNGEFDADDDGWEFKDAYSESKVGNGNDKVPVVSKLSRPEVQSILSNIRQEMQVDPKVPVFSEVTTFASGFGNVSHGLIDLFTASNGISSESHEMGNGFDFKLSTVAQNGIILDSNFRSWRNDTEHSLNSHLLVGSADSDESFGEYKAAFSEIRSKEEDTMVSNLSKSDVKELTIDCKNQGNETRFDNHKGAVPLSVFGDEELESDDSLNIKDVFMFKSVSYTRNDQSQGTNLSINEFLSNLYSQAERSVDSLQNPIDNGLHSTGGMLNSSLVEDDVDFDDDSWEFKDAFSQTRAKDQISPLSPEDAHENFSTKTKLNNFVDFYCKLKEELCFVASFHLDILMKAQSTAALSGEDAKVVALDDLIEEASKELGRENIISNEAHSEDHPRRDICLKEFLEVLHEHKFQVLESEYHLSRRLSIAEKDLRAAIELIKHATTMLKILKLVSLEEQSSYISTWSKIISVCARELKHGAWIWNQSLEKIVLIQILSEPRGKRFIFALGEIYRVVVVLGASVKLYKPWMLSSSVDYTGICALLEECRTLWYSSGLEEALSSISDPIGSEHDRTVEALLESINHVRDLDALALANHVFTQQESVCRLSVLTPGVVPDMKMVVWDGDRYFLTLANLWANLISHDPPKLPCLNAG